MKTAARKLCVALAIFSGVYPTTAGLLPVITSFQVSNQTNGSLTWTNQPGTNAFILEWTPSLAGSWAYAAPPLDLSISTNTHTTVSVPLTPPAGFYRLWQGFGSQTFHGAWMLTNNPQFYMMSDGNGLITNAAIYGVATPPFSYSMTNSSGGVLFTRNAKGGTIKFPGQFVPPDEITASISGTLETFAPVENLSLCAGIWTGTLTETNDPNGLNDYSIDLTVDTNGVATLSGDLSGTGWMFALGPTNGLLSSFCNTTSIGNYDQFRLFAILNGNTITGAFDTDSGSGAGAVNGTVTLTR